MTRCLAISVCTASRRQYACPTIVQAGVYEQIPPCRVDDKPPCDKRLYGFPPSVRVYEQIPPCRVDDKPPCDKRLYGFPPSVRVYEQIPPCRDGLVGARRGVVCRLVHRGRGMLFLRGNKSYFQYLPYWNRRCS